MNAPSKIRAGVTTSWRESLAAYPAGDWTLKCSLYKDTTMISLTAEAEGDAHVFSIPANTSAAYSPGVYAMYMFAENDEEGNAFERHDLGTQTVEILPNLAATGQNISALSHARQMVEAIRAQLTGIATHIQRSMSHNNRALQYLSHEELLKALREWQYEVRKEGKAERIAQGKCDRSNIVELGVGPRRL